MKIKGFLINSFAAAPWSCIYLVHHADCV